MSIWCSGQTIGRDEYDDPRPGTVLTYASGFSNHHPDETGTHELPAALDVATIAPWCVPGHEECSGCHYEHVGPWLRLSVWADAALSWWGKEKPKREPMHASVVLDEAAARELAADLLAWADRTKVMPIEVHEP